MIGFVFLLVFLFLVVKLMPAAFKNRLPTIQNVNQGVDEFYDFIVGNTNGLVSKVVSGGQVSQTSPGGDNVTYYPGSVELLVTLAGDTASVLSPYYVLTLGTSTTDFQIRIQPALVGQLRLNSTGSVTAGAAGVFQSEAAVEFGTGYGAYFYWNGSTSNNLICKFKSPLYEGTFITPHVVIPEDLYLRVIINPSSTTYYINNVLVNTFTHGGLEFNIASAFGFKAAKIDSLIVTGVVVDAIKLKQTLNPNRQFRNV